MGANHMSIDRTYRCNLCRDTKGADDLIGLWWKTWPKFWEERPAHDAENHVCMTCVSSIQALPRRCGQGFECDQGPKCGSDHK